VNVLLPNMPDAVINFSSPPALTTAVNDAATALGLLGQGTQGTAVTMASILTALGGSATATKASENCTLAVDFPAIVLPNPVQVTVYAKNSPIPLSTTPGGLAGVAADLETAINDALATQVFGSTITLAGVNTLLGGSSTATTADADCELVLNVPASVSTTALIVPLFAAGAGLPTSVASLASDVATALTKALKAAVPGSSASCTVEASGTGSRLLVSATIPGTSDPIISFSPTPPGVNDAAAALGLEVPPIAVACTADASGSKQAIQVTADSAVSFKVSATSPAIDAATPLGLVGAAATLPGPATVNVAHYTLGTDNASAYEISSTPAVPMDGLPGADELIGEQWAQSGIYALSKVAFNLLCIPDAVRASAGNPSVLDTNNTSLNPVAVYSAAIALCVQNRAMLLIDPPPTVTTVAAAVDWKSSTIGVFNANGAAFWPRLRLADPLNNSQLRTFAPSGLVAGVYANTDTTRGVWKAPAGIGAVLNGVQNMTYQMSDAENGVLNPLGLNCFRTFPVYGPVLWGARTLLGADADASQWKYVPIRRVALFIESSLYQGTQWVVFEPNDEPLWSAIRLNVGSFMQNLFIEGYFQGQTPTQAYFVKCDNETTTQTDIDNGIVNIVVGFAPLYPAEFVVIQIQQMTGQTTS
jgi:hypothetical protein